MKRPLKILLTGVGLIAITVLVIVANVVRSNSAVKGISVSIRYGNTPHLVEAEEVVDSITHFIPDIYQQRVRAVDKKKVAEAVGHIRGLRNVAVSMSVSGKVVVKARQRRPIARLLYAAADYYIDEQGILFPTAAEEVSTMVASGQFVEPLNIDSINVQVQELVKVAQFLDKHSNYATLIDQLYIQNNGNIMMAPRMGDHVIELGSAEGVDQKFANLQAFYRNGMPRAGWHTYSQISLKYDGQVVCTRK